MLLNTDLHGHVSSTWRCVLPSFPSSVGVFALMQYAFLENQDRVAEGTLNRSRGNCGCWGQSWGQTFSYCHCTLKPKSHLMSVIPYRHRQCSFLPRTYCIHQPCPRSSHGEVLATNLCGAAPIVLLFLVVQTCDTHLICKTAAMESLVSYRTRSDHSFPEHEANPSCSFSPRHYRKLLESITSQRPLDKLLGEQSSLPKGVAGWKTAEAMHRLDLFLKRQLDCSQCIERRAE